MLNAARENWAPPDDPVFRLVPPSFQEHIDAVYASIGYPEISAATFWETYGQLLEALRIIPDQIYAPEELSAEASAFEVDIPVLPNLRNIRMGDIPIGESMGKIMDLRHGDDYGSENEIAQSLYDSGDELDAEEMGMDLREYADFTDSE